MDRKEIGRRGEDHACRLLEARGYRVLHRNLTCKLGELDIVALDGKELVFVEVRSQTGGFLASAADSVNATKQKKLKLLARWFVQADGRKVKYTSSRFDVVGVQLDPTGRVVASEYIEDAFF